ncbi:MAG: radical SAM protein [Clostridia bacterium]|nr:radical SAM protein [Clostridia bacterium]
MKELNRYALIERKFPREMLLLVGRGCRWSKCTFCDYYNDVHLEPFKMNKEVLAKVSGRFGVLDVINSGSCFELDAETLALIKKTAKEKHIHTIWFECHWMYRDSLEEMRGFFDNIEVKFRLGVETFNHKLRRKWNKGIPKEASVKEIARKFDGICLLIGIKGQTKHTVRRDIKYSKRYFEYFSVNVFNKNSTDTKIDEKLISWFKDKIHPKLKKCKNVEILIKNTDLGLG